MNTYRILIVDDEEDICTVLKYNLESEGYIADAVYSAEDALRMEISIYNLIILDVMMGTISGFRLARILQDKPDTSSIPIIFLTAKDSENDRLTGFRLGAYDYIIKPFSIQEFLARVKVVFRKIDNQKVQNEKVIAHQDLEIHLISKKVFIDGQEIFLTKKEFEILKYFLENKNSLLTRDDILRCVWSSDAFVLDRTIDVNITRLRKKIRQYEKNIITRPGYGYSFEAFIGMFLLIQETIITQMFDIITT